MHAGNQKANLAHSETQRLMRLARHLQPPARRFYGEQEQRTRHAKVDIVNQLENRCAGMDCNVTYTQAPLLVTCANGTEYVSKRGNLHVHYMGPDKCKATHQRFRLAKLKVPKANQQEEYFARFVASIGLCCLLCGSCHQRYHQLVKAASREQADHDS